jgi:mitochondrial protein import protein ZIM17
MSLHIYAVGRRLGKRWRLPAVFNPPMGIPPKFPPCLPLYNCRFDPKQLRELSTKESNTTFTVAMDDGAEPAASNPASPTAMTPPSAASAEDTIEIVVNVPEKLAIPGTEKGSRTLALVFTCAICNTRSVKQFTERAYSHGVVIVTCPSCKKQHLIADRLGYFADDDGKTFDMNTLAERTGHSVKRVTQEDGSGLTTVTLEDIIGPEKMKEILQQAAGNAGTEHAAATKNDVEDTSHHSNEKQ